MSIGGDRDSNSSATPDTTARYIADMTREMSAMARTSDLEVIAFLLDMVRLEAEEILQNGVSN